MPQKTIPAEGHKARKASNGPETLSVSMHPVSKLTIELRGKPPLANGNVNIRKIHTNGETFFELVPLVKKPLTPAFSNNHGATGGRGTSRETLRRAKKKAKRNGNINPGK